MVDKFLAERARFPVLAEQAYFITSSTGLVPDYVREAVQSYENDRYFKAGDAVWSGGRGTLAMMADAKAALGDMLGCPGDDIAFGQNSSQLYSLAVQGLPLQKGDNVLLCTDLFISNRFAWQSREAEGIQLRYAPTEGGVLSIETLEQLVDEHTKVLSVAFVESSTGFRANLAALGEFCKAHGLWFFVDGVQGAGVFPLALKKAGVHCFVGNDYKWMLGFCGTGYAFFSPQLREVLTHMGAGWMSDDERFNTAKTRFSPRADAGRFEYGYPNAPGICALGLVAERYIALGAADIEAQVLSLVQSVYSGTAALGGRILFPFEAAHRSGIVYLALPSSGGLSAASLAEQGVIVEERPAFAAPGEAAFRLSLHYYNSGEDIGRFFAASAW